MREGAISDDALGDVQAAILAAAHAVEAESRMLDPEATGGVPALVLQPGLRVESLLPVLLQSDARAPAPRAREGVAHHVELDSFIAHAKRFADADSVVWADPSGPSLTAVLDYHRAGGDGAPRWGRHRAVYTCPLSEQWRVWTAKDGAPFSQDAFADFIEERMRDLAPPPKESDIAQPAKLVEIGRLLRVHAKSTFEREINPTTGEFSMVSKTEHDKSSTKIPRGFLLQIPIFDAGRPVQVEARLRFKIDGGRPSFSFLLVDVKHVLRAGFAEVRSAVAEGTGLPIFAGSPE